MLKKKIYKLMEQKKFGNVVIFCIIMLIISTLLPWMVGTNSSEEFELNISITGVSLFILIMFYSSFYRTKTGRGLRWGYGIDNEGKELSIGGIFMFFCEGLFTLYHFLFYGFKILVLLALIITLSTGIFAMVSGAYCQKYIRYKFYEKYQLRFQYTASGKKKEVKL